MFFPSRHPSPNPTVEIKASLPPEQEAMVDVAIVGLANREHGHDKDFWEDIRARTLRQLQPERQIQGFRLTQDLAKIMVERMFSAIQTTINPVDTNAKSPAAIAQRLNALAATIMELQQSQVNTEQADEFLAAYKILTESGFSHLLNDQATMVANGIIELRTSGEV